jgi:hypothetical protein
LACENCHTGTDLQLLFNPAPSGSDDCVTCHQPDYDTQHAGSGFPLTCLTCHTDQTWGDATFDHAANANGYELLGAHEPLACESCHTGTDLQLLFNPAPSGSDDCVTCHQPDYNTQHAGSGFPLTCLTCHTDQTWGDATFDHAARANGFELTGAHEPLACENCHTGTDLKLLFNPAPSGSDDCVTCHQPDYDTQHAGSGFPLTCLTCHTDQTWGDAVFDHAANANGYELLGAHEPLACENCHTGTDLQLLFSPAPAGNDDCATCHQPDYDTQHAGSGFPLTCLTCHTDQTWTGAVFDHAANANGFELLGAHEPLACESCHTGTDLQLLFNPAPAGNDDCATCHQPDYDTQHAGSGFPLTCLTCHTDQDWNGTPFTQHDALYFPIFSGEHQGEWNTCIDCHTAAPIELVTFSCLTCHEHDQTSMDSEHSGVSGYVYVSSACLTCHPNGDKGDDDKR